MRAYSYARKSPADTDEQIGVDEQTALCGKEIARKGWEWAGQFEDVAKSAYEAQWRPQYQALVAEIQAGKVDAVVVRHNDRLHRDVEEYKAFIRLIRKHKVQVVAVLGGDWTVDTASGRFSGTMLAAVAEYESALKAERINQALERRALQGLPATTSKRPYGFEEDCVTHRPKEAEALRNAARELLKSNPRSMRSLALEMGLTPTGLKTCLLSPRMVGKRPLKGIMYDMKWEPILDRETYDSLVLTLGNKPLQARPRRSLLSGLLVCGSCGKLMESANSHGRSVYTCKTGREKACPRKLSRRAEILDVMVWDEVRNRLVAKGKLASTDKTKDEAEAKIKALTERIEELEEQVGQPGVPVTVLLNAHKRLTRERDELRAESWLVRYTANPAPTKAGEKGWVDWWEGSNLIERRRLLSSRIETITALPEGATRKRYPTYKVNIDWKPW